jgi:hypothetical protein
LQPASHLTAFRMKFKILCSGCPGSTINFFRSIQTFRYIAELISVLVETMSSVLGDVPSWRDASTNGYHYLSFLNKIVHAVSMR